MKKQWIPALFILAAMLGSCRKCIECTVYDSNENIVRDSVKTCGNKTALDKARDEARDESSLLGGTYLCTDPE
jgi:hypothetical protein